MKHLNKGILLIVFALLLNIVFFNLLVYANTVNNGDTEEIKEGEKVDFNADPGSEGKGSGSGNQSNNNENQSTKTNQSQSTSKGKNPGSSSIQISPGSNSKQKTPGSRYPVPTDPSNRNSNGNYGFIVGSGAFGYTPGNGYYPGDPGVRLVDQDGNVVGTVTAGGRVILTDRGSSFSKKQTKTTRSKTTTSTSTTKGNTYTKKVRTVRYDWTIENVSDKSIPTVKRSTEKPTYTHTFNHTGKYYIEAVPYCYYEQGYDETTTTTTKRDGKVISRKHDTKFVKTKSYYAHDTKNKSTFTVIVTLDDVGEPVKLPPPDPGIGDPEKSDVKPVYELVE